MKSVYLYISVKSDLLTNQMFILNFSVCIAIGCFIAYRVRDEIAIFLQLFKVSLLFSFPSTVHTNSSILCHHTICSHFLTPCSSLFSCRPLDFHVCKPAMNISIVSDLSTSQMSDVDFCLTIQSNATCHRKRDETGIFGSSSHLRYCLHFFFLSTPTLLYFHINPFSDFPISCPSLFP